MSSNLEINENISSTTVRFIDENGVQKGIISLREALYYTNLANLDLVKISDSKPPVCKALDAGKYLYDQQKQQKQIAKKQKEKMVEIKEIQLSMTIDKHDLNIKAKKAKEFLESNNKVKIVIRLKGREKTFKSKAYEVIQSFLLEVGDHKVDSPSSESSNQIVLIINKIK